MNNCSLFETKFLLNKYWSAEEKKELPYVSRGQVEHVLVQLKAAAGKFPLCLVESI